ncbi:hypothetical protein LINGRAHAP2_LOCUS4136 [Linum grandiflorum]
MAATSFHVRSNSLPSRPHPIVSEVEENICRLRSSQSASTSSISDNLRNLQDLHECVDKLFELPLNQQALVQDQKFLNQLLDGSLRLLDFCNTANDALSQMKESVCQLQSVLRRKQGDVDQSDVKQYLTLRKAVNKSIQKALKNLKSIQWPSGWSFVSKLKQQKKVANEQEMNEFTTVDASLETLLGNKTNKCEKVQTQLKDLEQCIQDLEEGTECLYRRMIKSRVALLNIFN